MEITSHPDRKPIGPEPISKPGVPRQEPSQKETRTSEPEKTEPKDQRRIERFRER